MVRLFGNVKKAAVLLPQSNEPLLFFDVPPDSCRLYICALQSTPVLLVTVKECIVGEKHNVPLQDRIIVPDAYLQVQR